MINKQKLQNYCLACKYCITETNNELYLIKNYVLCSNPKMPLIDKNEIMKNKNKCEHFVHKSL